MAAVFAKRWMILLLLVGAAGCEDDMPYAYLGSEVRATPGVLVAGEEVELAVTVTNWGDETVFASNGCAPGLGFMVTRPDDEIVNPYPALPSTCQLLDSQVLEPGETDVVTFRWKPTLVGAYSVVGGLVVGDRLWSVSEEVGFEVRSAP